MDKSEEYEIFKAFQCTRYFGQPGYTATLEGLFRDGELVKSYDQPVFFQAFNRNDLLGVDGYTASPAGIFRDHQLVWEYPLDHAPTPTVAEFLREDSLLVIPEGGHNGATA